MRSFIPRTSPLKTTALAAMLMAVPLMICYELGVLGARVVERKPEQEKAGTV